MNTLVPEKKTVTSFFDENYLDYAKYVVESRAIPSVIDGLKPSQRKIICAANKVWKTGNEKPMKLFQLAGVVASTMFYHHGDASLSSAMVTLAQDFKNSMPLLEALGQFGSLRNQEAGAPRYISTKLHKNFRLLYKDFEILQPQFEEGEEIEPNYFLPVVPAVLLNSSSGIAVGFATNILNRKGKDLVKACLNVLDNKKIGKLVPYINGFAGTFEADPEADSSWIAKGTFEIKNTTTVVIDEIPPSFSLEKYESHLEKLLEKGIITDYDNMSSDKVNYVVRFQRVRMANLIEENKLDKTLNLSERITENLTCIGPNKELLEFNTPQEIVEYFVKERLQWYQVRKDYLIAKYTDQLLVLTNRARFISMIIDGKLKINNVKRDDVIKRLEIFNFDLREASYSYLLNLPIHSLTQEKYEEYVSEMKEKEIQLEETKQLDITEMYRSDLKELDKVLK